MLTVSTIISIYIFETKSIQISKHILTPSINVIQHYTHTTNQSDHRRHMQQREVTTEGICTNSGDR